MKSIADRLSGKIEEAWREATLEAMTTMAAYGTLLPFLRPEAIVDDTALRRAAIVVRAIDEASQAPYAGVMVVPPLLGTLPVRGRDPEAWAARGPALVEAAVALMARKGYEALAAVAIHTDVDEPTLEELFRRVATHGATSVAAADLALRKEARMKPATAAAKARSRFARGVLGVKRRAR